MFVVKAFSCLSVVIALFVLATAAGMAADAQLLPAGASTTGGQTSGAVRIVTLPVNKDAEPLALYSAPSKGGKLLSAVLVLFPDKGQDAKMLLDTPAWRNFAEDNQLGLIAVASAPRFGPGAGVTPAPVGVDQTSAVLKGIDHEFGGSLPLLFYSWPQRAALTSRLLTANAKRVLTWCMCAPEHIPEAGKVVPPGIVVCYKENKPVYDALMADFVQARKKGAALTWIALPGDKPTISSLSSLDAFVQKAFAALLHARVGTEQWQNIDTKLTISAADLGSHPEKASYLPHFTLAAAWSALHVPGGPELAQQPIIEREETTNFRTVPKIHFYLRKPLSAAKDGARIEGVLAFCTWKKERVDLVGRLQDRNDFLVRYAEEHRLALLTWDTATAYSLKESADQRSQQENFRDDQGFDKIASAWERGVHVLCHENNLPENDFLLYGMSRGAQWAHRLALRKPEHFLAVHIHINSTYDWPTPAAKNILWLQTTGEREYGYEAAKRFYARCRDMGYPILFKAGENLGHASNPQINALGLRFFDYALEVKARRDAALASVKPVRGKQTAPSMYALSGLDETPFYGDFINQEVCEAQEKDMVPAGQRVPLPNKALAQAWLGRTIIPALQTVNNLALTPGISVAGGDKSRLQYPPPAPAPGVASTKEDASGRQTKTMPPTRSPASSSTKAAAEDLVGKYRLSVQRAVALFPELAQADSAANAAFLSQYRRLKETGDSLLFDPSWPEQVARLVREQGAAQPDFAREFKAAVERAVLLCPELAQAGSRANLEFLAEYQRLKEARDPLLNDPTWPEQVARTITK